MGVVRIRLDLLARVMHLVPELSAPSKRYSAIAAGGAPKIHAVPAMKLNRSTPSIGCWRKAVVASTIERQDRHDEGRNGSEFQHLQEAKSTLTDLCSAECEGEVEHHPER